MDGSEDIMGKTFLERQPLLNDVMAFAKKELHLRIVAPFYLLLCGSDFDYVKKEIENSKDVSWKMRHFKKCRATATVLHGHQGVMR